MTDTIEHLEQMPREQAAARNISRILIDSQMPRSFGLDVLVIVIVEMLLRSDASLSDANVIADEFARMIKKNFLINKTEIQ